MNKTLITSIILFFFLTNIAAQNLEWNTHPEPISYVSTVLPNKDEGWIIGGSAEGTYLLAIDSVGNSLWGEASASGGFSVAGSIDQFEQDTDTSFYFIGETPSVVLGDVIIVGSLFLQRQHCNGQILNRIDFDFIIGDELYSDFKAFDILLDGSIVVATEDSWNSEKTESKITNITSTGQVEWSEELEDYSILDILGLENGGYLLATDKGVLVFDENHELENTIFEYKEILDIKEVGVTNFLVLTSSEIILLDDLYNEIGDFVFLDIQSFTSQFISNEDFYFTGKDKDDLPFVLKLNQNLEQQLYFTFGHADVFPKTIIFHNEKIGVGGQILTDPESVGIDELVGGSMFFKTFDETGFAIDYGKDISISNIDVGTAKAIPIFNRVDNYNLRFQNINVTIENFGLDTLNELKINYIDNPINRKQQKLFNLQIPPGGNQIVTLEPIEINGESLEEDNTFNLCLWTSVPDKKIDVNPVNDLFCEKIEVTIEDALAPELENIFIFPNPTFQRLNFSSPLPPNSFEILIFNSLGQEVYAIKPDDSSNFVFSMNVSNLSPGMHYLNLKSGEFSKTFPFVKM